MPNILLVDDEVIALKALEYGINWDDLGIEQVFKARNVTGAKAILDQHDIQVMICDIEMPNGNGIDLVRWMKDHYPNIVVILLTAHAEFQYAKEAVSLGVYDYALKPIIYKSFQEQIRKAFIKAGEIRDEKALKDKLEQKKDVFMSDFLHYLAKDEGVYEPGQMVNLAAGFQVRLDAANEYMLILVSVLNETDVQWHKMQALKDYIKKLFEPLPFYDTLVAEHNGERLVVILEVSDSARAQIEDVRETAVELVRAADVYDGISMVCYLSEFIKVNEMGGVFRKLIAKDESNVTYTNKVFLVSTLNADAAPKQITVNTSNWVGLLEEGKIPELISYINLELHHIVIAGCMDNKMLRMIYDDFIQLIAYYLKKRGIEAHEIMSDELYISYQSSALKSVKNFHDFAAWVLPYIDKKGKRMDRSNSLVSQVKSYIEEHLSENITRDGIADYVALHENYLSRMFRKETGESVSAYLLRRRIERAKELLVTTLLPIGDIALAVGYTHSAHFIKMFKREVGQTPKEYRDSRRSSEEVR